MNKIIFNVMCAVTRATKYALVIVTVLATYKFLLDLNWELFRFCMTNYLFAIVVWLIEEYFKSLRKGCE